MWYLEVSLEQEVSSVVNGPFPRLFQGRPVHVAQYRILHWNVEVFDSIYIPITNT